MTCVLVAGGGSGPSGITTYAVELGRALEARGHTVHAFVGASDIPGRRTLGRLFPLTYARPASASLRARIGALQPDVVHVVSSDLLRYDLDIPTVWTAWHFPHSFAGMWRASLEMRSHGPRHVLWELAGTWPGFRLDESSLRRCDRVAAVSRRIAADLSARGWPAEWIPPLISPSPSAVPRGLPPIPRVLYSAANLGAPRKGFDLLTQSLVYTAGRPIELDLIGVLDTRAKEIVRRRSSKVPMRFHGRVDLARAREILRGAAVLAMPSRSEEFGYVALEALALGIPVVGFKVPGLDEIIDSGCGRLVPPFDVEAFGSALSDLLGDAATYRQLSAGALRRAATFSPAKCVPKIEALYRQAAEEG